MKEENIFQEFDAKIKEKYSILGRFKAVLERRREEKYRRRMLLKGKLEKAGIHVASDKVAHILSVVCVIVNFFVTLYAFSRFSDYLGNYIFVGIMLLFIWVLMFILVFFVMWFLFYLTLDLAIFKRRQKLEEVLPDFLQLASSNIRAGMTVDQALWFAVRPRFGVLAIEIQDVAKRTFAGESLDAALIHFVKRYDSKVLERSINLLIEGLRAGGEMGSLLNKIATNIQETSLLKKEMAANVMTYVIFISFATIFAAPFMFGMAVQLITVIQEVFSRVNISPGATSGFPVNISGSIISLSDFQTFAVVSLLITSMFSAIIVSTIKKGNISGGFKYIPMFMISSVVLFFIVVKLFNMILGGFF